MEEKTINISGSSVSVSPPPSAVAPPANPNVEIFNSTGAAASIMTTSGSAGQGSFDLFVKKKRGRPRKYDQDGNLRTTQKSQGQEGPTGFSLSPTSPTSEHFSSKRGRGRPPGSGNWQLLASLGELFASTAGGDFTPHVVTVSTGEDVAGKILSFAQKGPRGICVLSANGAISNITIRQPGSSGGILTYEGRFEILSLSGSFTVTDNGGIKSRTGGLSVSLAGPDGRVIGGGVAGLLTAASPVQIVVGSFMPNGYKTHKRKLHREPPLVSPAPGGSEKLSEGLTPTVEVPEEQIHREEANYNNYSYNMAREEDKRNFCSASNTNDWNDSEVVSDDQRPYPYPDINVSTSGNVEADMMAD